jgi:KTSC domain
LVDSSNLYGVDYEPWSETLTITFHNGSVYEYYNVPAPVCDGLLAWIHPVVFIISTSKITIPINASDE